MEVHDLQEEEEEEIYNHPSVRKYCLSQGQICAIVGELLFFPNHVFRNGVLSSL